MKLKYYLAILILLITVQSYGQTGRVIKGTVIDSTKQTIPGATVKLLAGADSLVTGTDANGAFIFPSVKASQISLVISSIGYDPIRRRIMLDNAITPVILRPIILKNSSTTLSTVNIISVNPVKIKEDTIEFNAAAYKVRDGAMVEDVIKKLPGADVDNNGNVTFQGKTVSKVRVNGKDFFGGDIKTATQNLPADAVSNVQMINDYGDQANLTGIKSGEPETVLNINIKPSRNNGYFGQLSAGDGRDAIPQIDGTTDQNRFVGQANLFSFSGDRQIAVLGNLNNTNTSLFNFGPPGSQKPADGITTARSIGFNYRDSWSKKLTVYGSYSFASNSVNLTSSTLQNNISVADPSTNTLKSTEQDTKINHRFTFNMEYKPDTINYFKISPSFSYAGVNTSVTGSNLLANDTATLSNYNYKTLSNSSAPNYGINVLYNHRFNSHGRDFSVNFGVGRSTSRAYDNPVYTYINTAASAPLDQFINTNSHTDTVGASFSYIEPLTKRSYFQANYIYHRAYSVADKVTDTLATDGSVNNYPLLSNNYNFTLTTNRFGINYRFIEKKYNYVIGVVAQPTSLDGYSPTTGLSTSKTSFNFTPDAHFVYNFSRSQTLSANYTGTTNSPTFSELQPVTDFSNASYPITGNPDLKPEFNNTFSLRYNKFDFASGNVFFSNLSFIQTDNKIVANTITYPANYTPNTKLSNTIATQYLNANGYYSASGFYVFAKPFDNRRYNLFFIGNISYNNNISYISNVDATTFDMATEKNIAKTLVYTQGLRFRVDITDVIDAEPNTSYTINSSQNSLNQPGINDNFRTWNLGVTGKNYVWKDWTLSYDYTKTFYYNYKGSTNPNILNTYIERRFLKSKLATFRLSAFDLFNQNTGYSSTQNGNYVTQTNVNRLGRYYMLTFTLRLQKNAGKGQGDHGPGDHGPGGPGGGGPPPGGGGPGGGPSMD
ncbi:CarboxypepD_reg-like domain-containing protein [Mucilaginibacter mallensis]|uniref:CarboxypepD_reg-like domain-containing protein n=1 Tax=Mucilaginibacter mallensis TaxID=652787 RepID=A0A1H1Y9U0_MUCMA|nr:TonB-dependent receptor [Mucilaginibacter mallensis]SDT18161.1 CarboxypepD_reg-like domain-containing protein [Mucilaginibacter mallensis]